MWQRAWGPVLVLVLVLVLLPFLLCSCFAPEDFDLNINIERNGKLKVSYNGLLVFIDAKKSFIQKGEINKSDQDFIDKFHKSISKDKQYKQVTYLGGGQFKITYEYNGDIGEGYRFIVEEDSFVSLVPKSDHRVELLCYQVGKSTKAKLTEAQVKIRGKFTVTTDARVLAHNAASAPGQTGAPGAYRWEIKSFEDPFPYMLLQMEKTPGK